MDNVRSNRVYFLAGFTPRKGLFGAASFLHELDDDDVEFTRFYMTRDGAWGNQEFNDDVVSVCYTRTGENWNWWLLSKRGKVIALSASGRVEENIESAGTGGGRFGYLNSIKCIDGTLYAAGFGRQVYRRRDSQWIRMDEGMRVSEPSANFGLRDIDGLSPDTIHAVGYAGEIWHFDGERWQSVVSPTNLVLESVKVVSKDLCYICGKNGVVLRGFRDSWEVIESRSSEDFWSVAEFKGRIYLSGTDGFFTVQNNVVEALDVGRKVFGYRLYSNPEELWSLEQHEIWVFDGVKWEERVCPDNL
jgi:hypothetical protein